MIYSNSTTPLAKILHMDDKKHLLLDEIISYKNHPVLDDHGIIHYWMFKNIHNWMIVDDTSLSIEKNSQFFFN